MTSGDGHRDFAGHRATLQTKWPALPAGGGVNGFARPAAAGQSTRRPTRLWSRLAVRPARRRAGGGSGATGGLRRSDAARGYRGARRARRCRPADRDRRAAGAHRPRRACGRHHGPLGAMASRKLGGGAMLVDGNGPARNPWCRLAGRAVLCEDSPAKQFASGRPTSGRPLHRRPGASRGNSGTRITFADCLATGPAANSGQGQGGRHAQAGRVSSASSRSFGSAPNPRRGWKRTSIPSLAATPRRTPRK